MRTKCRIVHIHWPESLWRAPNLSETAAKVAYFRVRVRQTKMMGYRLVWSAHNLMPHECLSESIERAMRRYMLSEADLVIGHALNTAEELRSAFGWTGRRFAYASLGHYEGWYKFTNDRKAARRSLKIPTEAIVVAHLGSPAPYKGTAHLADALRMVNDPRLRVVVTGKVPASVEAEALSDPRLVRISGRLDDNGLCQLLDACDVLALPFSAITTSSSYYLALTAKRPVLAPDLPFFERQAPRSASLLYPRNQPIEGLADAMRRLCQGWKPDASVLESAFKASAWGASARTIAREYSLLLD
jgi:glycosyltransferase involved in cell wall biosynthesis